MEILQTIWNVLITENERLTNLILLPLIPIENYLYMLNFTNVLKIQSTIKQKVLYVLFISLLAIISIYCIPMPYYTFVNILLCPILVFFIFRTTKLKSILAEFVVYIISFIFCSPLILIYTSILKIPSTQVSTVPLYRITYTITFFILMYILYLFLKKKNLHLPTVLKFKTSTNRTILLNIIIGSISIAIQFYVEYIFIDYIPFYLILLSIAILLIYFTISLYSLIRTSKLEITTEHLEEQKLYNHTLTLLYDKIRGYKHDFNNTVQGIGGYIATNNMEGLKKYYSEILEDCQKTNNLAILSPEIINNPAIYSLLTAKYHEATELGIKVTLDIFMDLSTINMKIYDLTRILGILIDNAIDASKQCDEKEIIINFRKDNRYNKQLFIIENTYSNKDVNIDEIFEKGKSSKKTDDPKSHGLGLWEVRQIVKKNKNLNLYTTKSDKYFKQQFEIYC